MGGGGAGAGHRQGIWEEKQLKAVAPADDRALGWMGGPRGAGGWAGGGGPGPTLRGRWRRSLPRVRPLWVHVGGHAALRGVLGSGEGATGQGRRLLAHWGLLPTPPSPPTPASAPSLSTEGLPARAGKGSKFPRPLEPHRAGWGAGAGGETQGRTDGDRAHEGVAGTRAAGAERGPWGSAGVGGVGGGPCEALSVTGEAEALPAPVDPALCPAVVSWQEPGRPTAEVKFEGQEAETCWWFLEHLCGDPAVLLPQAPDPRPLPRGVNRPRLGRWGQPRQDQNFPLNFYVNGKHGPARLRRGPAAPGSALLCATGWHGPGGGAAGPWLRAGRGDALPGEDCPPRESWRPLPGVTFSHSYGGGSAEPLGPRGAQPSPAQPAGVPSPRTSGGSSNHLPSAGSLPPETLGGRPVPSQVWVPRPPPAWWARRAGGKRVLAWTLADPGGAGSLLGHPQAVRPGWGTAPGSRLVPRGPASLPARGAAQTAGPDSPRSPLAIFGNGG